MPAAAGRAKRLRRSGDRALYRTFVRRSHPAGRGGPGGGGGHGPVARPVSNACFDGACRHAGRSSRSEVNKCTARNISLFWRLKRHPSPGSLLLVMTVVDHVVHMSRHLAFCAIVLWVPRARAGLTSRVTSSPWRTWPCTWACRDRDTLLLR